MQHKAISIRTFIGAKNFKVSCAFYSRLGFEEISISKDMALFKVSDTVGFYLQDYYLKDWIDNSMIFLEVEDVAYYYNTLQKLDLPATFAGSKLLPIVYNDWGSECFLHDPSGVLWHFGQFIK